MFSVSGWPGNEAAVDSEVPSRCIFGRARTSLLTHNTFEHCNAMLVQPQEHEAPKSILAFQDSHAFVLGSKISVKNNKLE